MTAGRLSVLEGQVRFFTSGNGDVGLGASEDAAVGTARSTRVFRRILLSWVVLLLILPGIPTPAGAWSLPTASGTTFNSSEALSRGPILLLYLAENDCRPPDEWLKPLTDIAEHYGYRGVTVALVTAGTGCDPVAYPGVLSLRDPSGTLPDSLFGGKAMVSSFTTLIDNRGAIRVLYRPERSASSLASRNILEMTVDGLAGPRRVGDRWSSPEASDAREAKGLAMGGGGAWESERSSDLVTVPVGRDFSGVLEMASIAALRSWGVPMGDSGNEQLTLPLRYRDSYESTADYCKYVVEEQGRLDQTIRGRQTTICVRMPIRFNPYDPDKRRFSTGIQLCDPKKLDDPHLERRHPDLCNQKPIRCVGCQDYAYPDKANCNRFLLMSRTGSSLLLVACADPDQARLYDEAERSGELWVDCLVRVTDGSADAPDCRRQFLDRQKAQDFQELFLKLNCQVLKCWLICEGKTVAEFAAE